LADAAIPGWPGAQFSPGISAKAPPPTATVPASSSATWLEPFYRRRRLHRCRFALAELRDGFFRHVQ
jgi:hypothetical protein